MHTGNFRHRLAFRMCLSCVEAFAAGVVPDTYIIIYIIIIWYLRLKRSASMISILFSTNSITRPVVSVSPLDDAPMLAFWSDCGPCSAESI